VLTANTTSAPAQSHASSTAASSLSTDAAAFASLSLSDPSAASSSSAAPAQASTQAGLQVYTSPCVPACSPDHTMQANTAASPASRDSAAPTGSSAVRNVSSRQGPVCGDPAPLTLQALQCGGWACGGVMMQQQEQSCWVRFKLPAQLKTDQEVAAALQGGNIVSICHKGQQWACSDLKPYKSRTSSACRQCPGSECKCRGAVCSTHGEISDSCNCLLQRGG
jgi:hypothetical protein